MELIDFFLYLLGAIAIDKLVDFIDPKKDERSRKPK